MITETLLEQQALAWFAQTGWEALKGIDVAPNSDNPLRADFKEFVLKNILETSLIRINPNLPEDAIQQAITSITKPPSHDLLTNNQNFYDMLINGIPVQYKDNHGEVKDDHAFIIDFEKINNNRFQAINQFTITGTKHGMAQQRRPDIICFINGLPIAVIELKNPNDKKTDITHAYHQIKTYQHDITDVFTYNIANIISDGYEARIGSLTANLERYMQWKDIDKTQPMIEWQLETLIKTFFDHESLLIYMRYFTIFDDDGAKISKKIANYHQFYCVRDTLTSTINAINNNDHKAGVVWHTQGSGKSITMCCSVAMLAQQPQMRNPTFVIVTDRNDLDGQLFTTFSRAQSLLKQSPVQANNREELRAELQKREIGGIIFTTIQKFALNDNETHHPILNNRDNIIVICDEAHRSQYGLKAKLKNNGNYQYGYAKYLRDAIPNAKFIGYTGTPISQEDKDTRAVFGDYISVYDIQDAVNDGATVPIYYEPRSAKLDINRAEIETLSQEIEILIEDEDANAQEKTKGEWSRLEKLIGTKPRLQQIARDIISHFNTRNEASDGKAMIVAMSRDICVRLYNEIIALQPNWHNDDINKGNIKIMMTGSSSDTASLQPHIYPKSAKEIIEKRFKDDKDSLKLIIVCDMWLTGFDVPSCHTIYIDKPMKDHNLMQAIARVNRVFKDKQGGLVVDYIGIANELKQALKTYTDANGKGTPTLNADEALKILLTKYDAIRAMLNGFDYTDYEKNAIALIVPAIEHILAQKDGKKRFLDNMLALTKAYSLCATLDDIKNIKTEIAFFDALRVAMTKTTNSAQILNQQDKNSILKHILDNAILPQGVSDIFNLCGLEKPNIGLLSNEFLDDVRQMAYKNLAIELLERLLKDNIRAKTQNNVVQQKKYADRLTETLRKYHNRTIETAQVIEELIAMAKDFQADLQRKDGLGLNDDEIAFYDALANNESAVRDLGDAILKQIATEITENLRNSTTIDWQMRESVRSALRIRVRRILRKYKYPPDKQETATDLVLQQAEALSNEWSQ